MPDTDGGAATEKQELLALEEGGRKADTDRNKTSLCVSRAGENVHELKECNERFVRKWWDHNYVLWLMSNEKTTDRPSLVTFCFTKYYYPAAIYISCFLHVVSCVSEVGSHYQLPVELL